MTCPNCGGEAIAYPTALDLAADPDAQPRDMLWTCTCCEKAGCHRCMAQYPGTTACAECRGKLQIEARKQGAKEITTPGQKREDRIKELFDAAWKTHLEQHAMGG